MPEPFNPFSFFATPEFKQQDIWEKWLQYQEVVPNHPDYMTLTPRDRELIRGEVLGVMDKGQLYPALLERAKDADSQTRSRLFNQMMVDDFDWQKKLTPEDKLRIRKELGVQIDPADEFTPPPGYTMPSRPITPPTPEQGAERITSAFQNRQRFQEEQAAQIQKDLSEQMFAASLDTAKPGLGTAHRILSTTPVVRSAYNPFVNFFAQLPGAAAETAATGIDFLGVAAGGPTRGAAGPNPWVQQQLSKVTDPLHEFGREYKEAAQQAMGGRRVQRLEDIGGVGDAMIYGLETISEMAGFMATIYTGGGIAGAGGRIMALAIPSISEVSDNIYERTGEYHPELALPLGLAVMSLEKVGFETIGESISKPLKKKLTNAIIARLYDSFKTGGVEGLTETAQEMISITGERLSDEEQKLFASLTPEERSRLVNSAVAGWIGGAGMSSIGGGFRDYLTPEEQTILDKLRATLGDDQITAVESMVQRLMLRPVSEEDIKRQLEKTRANIAGKEATRQEVEEMERVFRERIGMPEQAATAPQQAAPAVILDQYGKPLPAARPPEGETVAPARPDILPPRPDQDLVRSALNKMNRSGKLIDDPETGATAEEIEALSQAEARDRAVAGLNPQDAADTLELGEVSLTQAGSESGTWLEAHPDTAPDTILDRVKYLVAIGAIADAKDSVKRFQSEMGRLKFDDPALERGWMDAATAAVDYIRQAETFETGEAGRAAETRAEGFVPTEQETPVAAREPGQRQLEMERAAAALQPSLIVRPGEQALPSTGPILTAAGEVAQIPPTRERVPLPRVRTEVDSAMDFMVANGMTEGAELLGRLRDREDLDATERATLDREVAKAAELEPEIAQIKERVIQDKIERADRIFTDEDLVDAIVGHVDAGATTQAEIIQALGEQNKYATDAKKVAPILRRLAEAGRISREKVKGQYVLGSVSGLDQQMKVFNDATAAQRRVWDVAKKAGIDGQLARQMTEAIGEEGATAESLAAADVDAETALQNPEFLDAVQSLVAAAKAYDEFHGRTRQEAVPEGRQPVLYGASGEVISGDRGGVVHTGPAFAERAVPALEARLQQLSTIFTDTEAFANSDFYDGTYPLPRQGGIFGASQSSRYATDPEYRAKVDAALQDIADTVVRTNAQLSVLRLSRGGVDFLAEKVTAKPTADPLRAWKMEAMSKYKEAGNFLGNISVREGVQNAIDAVVMALDRGEIKKGQVKVTTDGSPHPWATGFTIEDNGIGMSDIDIRDVFLSLHSTGKDNQLTAGGFGTGKAIIIVPVEGATWKLWTRDNYFDDKLAGQEAQIQESPYIKGTKLEVKAPVGKDGYAPDIIDATLDQYLETSEFPKSIELIVNGKKPKNPFARKKFSTEEHHFEVKGKTTDLTIRYYPSAPTGANNRSYNKKMIIRLVNQKTGVILTQNVRDIYDGQFKGTIIADITTEATPGEEGYPLDNSRLRLEQSIRRPIDELIAAKSQEGLSAQRDIVTSKEVFLVDYGRWGDVIRSLDNDPEYKALAAEAEKIFTETEAFTKIPGALNDAELINDAGSIPAPQNKAFTGLRWLKAKVDIGFKGPKGSKFIAKHLLAYEFAARLMSRYAGAPVYTFYPLFSKKENGVQVLSEYGGGDLGYNPYGVRGAALSHPLVYAMYIKDLVDHELNHWFVSGHTEDFTSNLPKVQQRTAPLLPYLIRIAEKVLEQEDTLLTRTQIQEVEVTKTKFLDRYLTPEQREFIYENFEQDGPGGAFDDLYFPLAEGEDWQLGLFEPTVERSTASVSGDEAPADGGRGPEQPGGQGDVVAGRGGVGTGGVPTAARSGGRPLAPRGQPGSVTKLQRSPAMQEMANRYQQMLNEADTHEKLDRAIELWSKEKRRPWGINFEAQVKMRRQLIGRERKPTREQVAAMARGRRLERRGTATEPAKAAPVAAPVSGARPVLYDAAGREIGGAQAQGLAPEAAAKPETGRKAPAKPAPKVQKAEQPLNPVQQKVMDAIDAGKRTITQVEQQTGVNRKAIGRIFRQLEKMGLIDIGIQPKGDGQERFYVLKPGEQVEGVAKADMEARDRAAREKAKAKKEAAKPETEYERVKREYEQAVTAREAELEDRKRAKQAGHLQIGTTKEELAQNEQDVEARNAWARKWWDRLITGGSMSVGQQEAFNKLTLDQQQAAIKWAQADRKLIDIHVRRLSKTRRDRNRIGQVMTEYLMNNLKTEKELADILKIDVKDQAIIDLKKKRDENSQRHRKLLESGLLPKDVQAALEDNEFYLRMAYARFLTDRRLLGRWRRYQPTEVDKKLATDVIETSFAKEIERVIKAVQDVAITLPKEFDTVAFMNDTKHSATEHMLKGMDGKQAEALKILRDKVQEWGKAIRFTAAFDGLGVSAVRVADEIRRHAVNAVNNLLDPKTPLTAGGELKNVRNLERRVLSDVFRQLYGEIKDPGVLQALTVEAQGNLLAQAAFFNEMLHMGEGVVWTREANSSQGLTARLGTRENQRDVFRYGALAGAYVDPKFKEFLDGTGQIHTSINDLLSLGNPDGKIAAAMLSQAYGSLQGTTRMMALMTVGAWWRNMVSSVLTFALQSGDALHVAFYNHFRKALDIALRAWVGQEKGMRELATAMSEGAFSYAQASIVTDLKPAVGQTAQRLWEGSEPLGSSWRVAKNIPRKLKEFYILIDFAAKKAAWQVRHDIAIKKGLSEELAVQHASEHVDKFYQNANRVPKIIQQIGVLGFGDFLGFKYDSGRMAVNSLNNAFVSLVGRRPSEEGSRQAKFKGVANEHPELLDTWQPMVGFAMARVWPVAFGLYGPGQYLLGFGSNVGAMAVKGTKMVMAIMSLFRPDDEEEKKEIEEATPEMEAAVNEISASYDANMPKWVVLATDAEGKKSVMMTPLGSQFGNAAEDWMLGHAQRINRGGETLDEIIESNSRPENLMSNLPVGMTYQNLIEAFTGFDPQTQFRQKNVIDAIRAMGRGESEKAWDQIKGAFLNFIADSTGGLGRSYKEMQVRQERAGREPTLGTRLKRLDEDTAGEVIWNVAKPLVRLLRIKEYDEEEVLRILPYKMGAVTGKVQGSRNDARFYLKQAKKLGEYTTEELAKSQRAEQNYIDGLRDAESRLQKMRPLFDFLGVSNEALVATLLEDLPKESGLTRDETEAVVYGKVDEYLKSEKMFRVETEEPPEPGDKRKPPEVEPSRRQFGEDVVREMLKADPYTPSDYIIMQLQTKGYKIEDEDEYYRKIRGWRKDILEKSTQTTLYD